MERLKRLQVAQSHRDTERLASDLALIFKKLGAEPVVRETPSIKDAVYAKMLAAFYRELPASDGERLVRIRHFLKQTPGVARWAREKITTDEGGRNLLALLRFELR